jgi:hypothetical protein
MYDFSQSPPTRRRDGFHPPEEMEHDLDVDYTLLSEHFYYFGRSPVELPEHLRPIIHEGRAHNSDKNAPYVESFVEWITSEFESNRLYGTPCDMPQTWERIEIEGRL